MFVTVIFGVPNDEIIPPQPLHVAYPAFAAEIWEKFVLNPDRLIDQLLEDAAVIPQATKAFVYPDFDGIVYEDELFPHVNVVFIGAYAYDAVTMLVSGSFMQLFAQSQDPQ